MNQSAENKGISKFRYVLFLPGVALKCDRVASTDSKMGITTTAVSDTTTTAVVTWTSHTTLLLRSTTVATSLVRVHFEITDSTYTKGIYLWLNTVKETVPKSPRGRPELNVTIAGRPLSLHSSSLPP